MFLTDGRRVLVGNVVVSIVTVVVTLYLTQEHVQIGRSYFLGSVYPRLSHSAQMIGAMELELPHPFEHVSAVVALPTGLPDAGHVVMRFFAKNLHSQPSRRKVEGEEVTPPAPKFNSESTLLAHLLLSDNRRPLDTGGILHLCSATCCVAPYLTRQYATVAAASSGEPRFKVAALVYGDVFVGSIVESDLSALGVLVPHFVAEREWTGAMPLWGAVGGVGGRNRVSVRCIPSMNSCQYVTEDIYGTAAHPIATVIPLERVTLSDSSTEVRHFSVVHIDLKPDELLAAVVYLADLLNAPSRPANILIVLQPSPALEEVVVALDSLRKRGYYTVHIVDGRCKAVANSSSVPSAELLRFVLQEATMLPTSVLNSRSYVAEPLCTLLLSGTIKSLSVFLNSTPTIQQDGAMKTFLGSGLQGGGHKASCGAGSKHKGRFVWVLLVALPLLVFALLACGMVYGKTHTLLARGTQRNADLYGR